MPLLSILDHVPSDVEMMGHDLDGHVPTKFQRVAFEQTGIAVVKIGEVGTNLADHVAG